MFTTVWIARHGDVHNPRERLYGRLPRIRLTPEGNRQARALAAFLAPHRLAAVYSSPMLRARRTAEAVVAQQTSVQRVRIDSDLMEIRTSWEGEALASLENVALVNGAHAQKTVELDENFVAHERQQR